MSGCQKVVPYCLGSGTVLGQGLRRSLLQLQLPCHTPCLVNLLQGVPCLLSSLARVQRCQVLVLDVEADESQCLLVHRSFSCLLSSRCLPHALVDEQVLHALAPCPMVVQAKRLDVDALVGSYAALFAVPAIPARLTLRNGSVCGPKLVVIWWCR